MKKLFLILIALSLTAAAGYFLLFYEKDDSSRLANSENTTSSNQQVSQNETDEFPSEEGPRLLIGNEEAAVVITEFVDYNCPNCNTFHRTVKQQLEDEYGDLIVFEIHQTPFIGPDSGRAARGAYCSEIHGGVFEGYHDGVFTYMYDNFFASGNFEAEFEDVMTEDVLTTIYAQAGGTDSASFMSCINDRDTIDLYINADQLLAAEKEVRGTPSFVIGETSLVGPQQYSVFKALIEAEL